MASFLECRSACAFADMFMSGSDDGTARHFDMRESTGPHDVYGLRTGDIIGEEVTFVLGHLPACKASCRFCGTAVCNPMSVSIQDLLKSNVN